jgi:type II secretory pathway pseudopilin PulG
VIALPTRHRCALPTASDATAGETLLEVLIALVVIGIAGAAVMTAFGTSVTLSGVHRRLTRTDTDARNFADRLVRAIDTKSLAYAPCATQTSYPPAGVGGFSASPGDTVTITGVTYWNGTSFTAGCTPSTDAGVQRVAVTITNADVRATTSVQVVIRKPCLLSDVTSGPCP